jgi:hypothetical protein
MKNEPVSAPSLLTKEQQRLKEHGEGVPLWRRWGPFVSERAWGTVREDYSREGNAWHYLTHDQARSRAYRWGEDGLAGICDRYQLMVFALALWNGRDPILKERAFGLTPSEANHGEDVKEYYFYLDSTPTHSYMKFLYKYPQAEFPYARLIEENQKRNGHGFEYELMDTGIFDEDKYFDVFVEYAKASPEDICIRIEAFNRGPEDAPLHIIPHLWFRNTWGWTDPPGPQPLIWAGESGADYVSLIADHSKAEMLKTIPFKHFLGERYLYADAGAEVLFTNNETNPAVNSQPRPTAPSHYFKDAFHRYIINGEQAVNPALTGTKSCLRYERMVPAGGSVVVRLRLTRDRYDVGAGQSDTPARKAASPLEDIDKIIEQRRGEADEFYESIHPPKASADERRIQRQAFAGLLWSKQSYIFDVHIWLDGDNPNDPPPEPRWSNRNAHWQHLNSLRVLSMPDKWEYPWFAAWDLAFQCVALALVDAEFAKENLWLMLFEQFQHPNGQIPAYEWEFSDLNPPVHAWGVWRVYNMDRIRNGHADRDWLEKCFHKLLINFAWWVNKVDREGNNIFEGGFLGLDNITVIDRSEKQAGGVVLEQSDATGWMGMFCLNLMRIALELAKENKVYESLATKFFEHYVYVGAAMKRMGGRDYSLWDEKDGFFYDVLRYPDGDFHKFRVRSLVGIIPLYAIERLEINWIHPFEVFRSNLEWFVRNRQDIVQRCVHLIEHDGMKVYVLAIVDEEQMKGILDRVFDSQEFLSDYGIRSLSKFHQDHPYVFGNSEVRYEPAESDNKIKGGNSNWRGPIWFPTTFLLIESLRKLGKAYGPDFSVPLPDGSGRQVTLTAMAEEIANRLIRIFTRDEEGKRPVYGGTKKFQDDPHWRDYILFYEYFHGDNGAGIGASHQTGWTALVASLIDEWRR